MALGWPLQAPLPRSAASVWPLYQSPACHRGPTELQVPLRQPASPAHLAEPSGAPTTLGKEGRGGQGRVTSLLSREASLLSPGARARPSLLLLRATGLAEKACSSEGGEMRAPDHRPGRGNAQPSPAPALPASVLTAWALCAQQDSSAYSRGDPGVTQSGQRRSTHTLPRTRHSRGETCLHRPPDLLRDCGPKPHSSGAPSLSPALPAREAHLGCCCCCSPHPAR